MDTAAPRIEWKTEPVFALRNDGRYDTFECIAPGLVELDGVPIEFPLGWITDVTSSPRWARGFVNQLGPHAPAALLHDRLLDLGYPRGVARMWMRLQLDILDRVGPVTRFLMPLGVAARDLFL